MSAAGDFEACAEVVPEFDAVLAAGLQEAEKAVAAIAAGATAGSAADLALGDLATNVVLGAVGVQWDLGPSSTISNSLLLARRRASRRSSEAKRVLWPKIRSNRADKTALRAGEGWRRQALRLP